MSLLLQQNITRDKRWIESAVQLRAQVNFVGNLHSLNTKNHPPDIEYQRLKQLQFIRSLGPRAMGTKRKRTRAAPRADAKEDSPAPPEEAPLLKQLRDKWEFAAVTQFLNIFGPAFKIPSNWDIEVGLPCSTAPLIIHVC